MEPNNIPVSRMPYDEFLDSAEQHLLDTINESGAILYLLTVTFAQTMNVNQTNPCQWHLDLVVQSLSLSRNSTPIL